MVVLLDKDGVLTDALEMEMGILVNRNASRWVSSYVVIGQKREESFHPYFTLGPKVTVFGKLYTFCWILVLVRVSTFKITRQGFPAHIDQDPSRVAPSNDKTYHNPNIHRPTWMNGSHSTNDTSELLRRRPTASCNARAASR